MPKLTIYRSPPVSNDGVLCHPCVFDNETTQSNAGRKLGEQVIAGECEIDKVFTYSKNFVDGIRVAVRLSKNYNAGDFVVIYKDHVLPIDTTASLPYWPEGLSDQSTKDMEILISGKE